MSQVERTCLFQAILVEHQGQPLRVLEQYYVPANRCTLDNAKRNLKERFEDKQYSRRCRALWPDAVRFLDQSGNELLRYTTWAYLREITTTAANQD